jgi:hypothetical protein
LSGCAPGWGVGRAWGSFDHFSCPCATPGLPVWWSGGGVLGGTQAFVAPFLVGWGSARCWVLRRHLWPRGGGCFFWVAIPGLDHLTLGVVLVVVVVGWGVVVC